MILLIMRMKVISEKRLELSQVIASLTGSIRTKKGCRRCDISQSMENENELCLIEEWDTLRSFRAHLKSELFKVIRGAMNLLENPCDVSFYTVLHSEKKDLALFWNERQGEILPARSQTAV